MVLVAGAMLIEARSEGLDGQLKTLCAPISAFLIGLFIAVIILGLGGPTGGGALLSCLQLPRHHPRGSSAYHSRLLTFLPLA